MKKNILRTAVLLLFFAGNLTSCEEKNADSYTANGKIIGYMNCQGNFGLFIITEKQDSLLAFNISSSSINISSTSLKTSVYGMERCNVSLAYRIAVGKEIKPETDLICFQNAMDTAWKEPIGNDIVAT